MALVITHEPTDISLSKNVIYYSFGNGLFQSRGVQAVYITGNTKLDTNDTIIVNWTDADAIDYSLTFTAVVSPTTDLQIQDDSTAATFLEWLQLVSDKIGAHPQLSPFFKTFIGDDDPIFTITIEALEISEDWSVEFDNSGVTIAGTSVSQDLTISQTTLPDNYKIHLEVFFEKTYLGNDWVRVLQSKATPANLNNVSFQINDVLNSELKKSYSTAPIPATDVSAPYLADNLRRYYVRYTEESGTPAVKSTWNTAPVKTLLCGGIDQEEFATIDFFSGLGLSNSFLTNSPDGSEVSINQPKYLSWYNYTGSDQELQLIVEVFDEDNAGTTANGFTSSFIVAAGRTSIIPCGYTQLNLAALSIDIKRYTVHLFQFSDTPSPSDEILSSVKTFVVDDSYQEHERHLLYLNAFCLPEVIRCLGELSSDLVVTREESAKILPPDYSITAEEIIQHNEDFQISYTYRTGYLTREEKEALQEMLIYNDLFEILTDGYLALYVTDNKFNIADRDRQNRFSLQFDAKPRLKKKIKNNDLLTAPISWIDPAGESWVTPDGESWIFN